VKLTLGIGADGALVVGDGDGRPMCQISDAVGLEFLSAGPVMAGYSLREGNAGVIHGSVAVVRDGLTVSVDDEWRVDGDAVRLLRRGSMERRGVTAAEEAVRVGLDIELPGTPAPRFFAPGMAYSPAQWGAGGTFSFSDHRLAYPVVARWSGNDEVVVWLARATTGKYDNPPRRTPGLSRFEQETDIGSVGFSTRGADQEPTVDRLVASWPYWEGDTSAMLDATGRPAAAFASVPVDGLSFEVEYEIGVASATTYVEAVSAAFQAALNLADPQPSPLPVSLEESVQLRLDSAAKTFRVGNSGFAAFVLNFDPEQGYDSEAQAFGASFAEHRMSESREIVEYGFTGRQLNLAYLLAERDPDVWQERGAAVVGSFVDRMTMPTGWVHTLWHAALDRPLFACGDPSGPVMHYLGESREPGTYTRMMAEAGCDLLLNITLHRSLGANTTPWRDAALRLGSFFLSTQESDGSWFRAYTPEGRPIVGSPWFGDRAASGKTATGAVVPFLTALAAEAPEMARQCLDATRQAARFLLGTFVAQDEYLGGTLDNPNLVDKEAAFITMRALLRAADAAAPDEAADYRDGARRVAEVAVTWHSIWPVPNIPGTALAEAGVRSVGWGGINSVWGVGVTDIYSLFFLADLHRLGVALRNDRFVRIARLIAASSVQLLAVPGNLHGFADAGMQPEGISFCPQGVDDGLIAKGATWGGLGWPYTAGTFGLREYLSACAETPDETSTLPDSTPVPTTR
jgi:hypothetical protein